MNDTRKFFRKITAGLIPVIALIVLWSFFFHPVPSNIADAIPFTAHHVSGPQCLKSLVPGDHLQLLYHFQLLKDTISGNSPMFHNVYEFNTGNDAERINPDPGYVPFSFVFALVSGVTENDALAWNISQLAALICSMVFLYLLAIRYSENKIASVLSAALAMCIPYQWVNLAVGSPSGFGMAMVPLAILGLDIAIRDRRVCGGIIAGAGMLFCYTSDLHCFFFIVLFSPVWCFVAASARDSAGLIPDKKETARLIKSLWPTALCGAVSLGIAAFVKTLYASTAVSSGRDAAEVIPNSPVPTALFGLVKSGASLHFRIGAVVAVFAFICVVFAAIEARRPVSSGKDLPAHEIRRKKLFLFILCCCVIGIVCLGLGYNGPFGGFPIRVVRKLLTPYRMIRQPVKILVLMPTVLVILFAFGSSAAIRLAGNTALRRNGVYAILIATTVCGVIETASALRVGMNRLPPLNGAYSAASEVAGKNGKKPCALVLPIWPGDSTWSSLYEYYAMKGHLRMLNGYAPVRSPDYDENVFAKFESITQGRLTGDQVSALLEMGVTSIILHETAFPDKVSPLPVAYTLDALRMHPRLKTIAHDGSVWAFEIMDREICKKPLALSSAIVEKSSGVHEIYPVARVWRLGNGSESVNNACGKIAVSARSPIWMRDSRFFWNVRFRGMKDVEYLTDSATEKMFTLRLALSGKVPDEFDEDKSFVWKFFQATDLKSDWQVPLLEMTSRTGCVAVADITLGYCPAEPITDGVVTIPANRLFRAGYAPWSDEFPDSVYFRDECDPPGILMYGPNLPFADGEWSVEVSGEFSSCEDAILHVFSGKKEIAFGPVGIGTKPVNFISEDLGVISFNFEFLAVSDVRVDRLTVKPVKAADSGVGVYK